MLGVVAEGSELSGRLIVRVRLRTGGPAPELFARITTTRDLATREEARESAGSVAETMAIVERWLEAFVAAGPGDGAATER